MLARVIKIDRGAQNNIFPEIGPPGIGTCHLSLEVGGREFLPQRGEYLPKEVDFFSFHPENPLENITTYLFLGKNRFLIYSLPVSRCVLSKGHFSQRRVPIVGVAKRYMAQKNLFEVFLS